MALAGQKSLKHRPCRFLSLPAPLGKMEDIPETDFSFKDRTKRVQSTPNLLCTDQAKNDEAMKREVDEEQSIRLEIPFEFFIDPSVKSIKVTEGYVNREEFSLWIFNFPTKVIIKKKERWLQWATEVSQIDKEVGGIMFERQEQALVETIGNSTQVSESLLQLEDPFCDNTDDSGNDVEKRERDSTAIQGILTPTEQALIQNGYSITQITEAIRKLQNERGEEINITASDLFDKIEETQDGQEGATGGAPPISDADAFRKVTCVLCKKNEIAFRFGPCMHTVACRECYNKPTQCPVCSQVITERDAVRLRE